VGWLVPLTAQLSLDLPTDRCGCGRKAKPFLLIEESFAPRSDLVDAMYVATICDACGNLIEPWRAATPHECRTLTTGDTRL
jgi:hypothetical protein